MVSRNHKRNPHQWKHYNEIHKILDRYAKELSTYFSDLSDGQVEQAHKMVTGLSTTNCCWMMYETQQIMLILLDIEAYQRLRHKGTA